MPPPPPFPALAAWFGPLLTALTFGAPLLLVVWLAVRRRAWMPARAWMCAGVGLLALLLLAAAGWYVEPDFAGSPRAAVASTLVATGPALAITTGSWLLAQSRAWPMAARVTLSLVAGYLVLAACLLPALVIFVDFGGGDTL